MKYNIYSPVGRTGSVRLLNIININFHTLGLDHFKKTREYIHQTLHLSETDTPGNIMCRIQDENFSEIPLEIIEIVQFSIPQIEPRLKMGYKILEKYKQILY